MNEKLKLVIGREGNIVGQVENTGNQHFLLFPEYLKSPLLQHHLPNPTQ